MDILTSHRAFSPCMGILTLHGHSHLMWGFFNLCGAFSPHVNNFTLCGHSHLMWGIFILHWHFHLAWAFSPYIRLIKETVDHQEQATADVSTFEHIYYDVLNLEGDELFSLSHRNIMARTCKVNLEQLTETDVLNIKKALNPERPDDIAKEGDPYVGLESAKPKRLSHHPMKRPSRERLRAQQLITKCNRKIRSHNIKVKPILSLHSAPPIMGAPVTDKQEPAQAPDVHEDDGDDASDDTIIYTPPVSPADRKGKKPAAKFVFRTVGIKIHKDNTTVIALKKPGKCSFKSYLCQKSFPTTKTLNKHFKVEHGGLECDDCGKEFTSPLSLKKHSYVHKLCPHHCCHCDKVFPFKSQRDFHENVHATLQYSCTQPGCKSSFTRESDLKLHLHIHDTEPLKCLDCEYSNPDIRNLRQHQRSHSGEKPYKCNTCEARFMYSMQKKHHKCPNK